MATRVTQIAVSAAALLLAGCTVEGKPVLTRSGAGLQPGAELALAPATAVAEQDALVADALRQALAERGYKVADKGRYELSYAIAERPAATGLAPGDGGKEPDWISPPRHSSPLARCKATSTRISLVAYEIATGTVAYRGTGEQQGCKLDRAITQDLVKALISQAAAR